MENADISNSEMIVTTSQSAGEKEENDSKINSDEFGSDLNLHISDDSNHHSESYEYIDYDPDNALEYVPNNTHDSNTESEHSGDDSESTEQIEGISSYEELTSQDELEDSQCRIDNMDNVEDKLAAIMNMDTQVSKDSDGSSRVVADMMYKVQPESDENHKKDQATLKAAKRIQFTDDTKTEMNLLDASINRDQQTSDYESVSTSDSFESHLEKAKEKQNCIEEKMRNLLKSLMILNVRNMAKHMSNEVASLYEYMFDVYNSRAKNLDEYNPDVVQKFTDYSSMLTEIQNFNMNQEMAWSRQKHHSKYFGAGSSAYQMHPKCVPQTLFPSLEPKEAKNIKDACEQFNTQLRLLETTLDSEATESSSSDDSDGDESYNNEFQRQLPLSKRVSTQIKKLENSYGSRMRWIQLHVTFLEIQKKYHDYIHSVIQTMKSHLKFIDMETNESIAVNSMTSVSEESCARIRPLDTKCFKKRRLVQTANLHTVSKLAAQTCSIKCGCQWPYQPCALCTGRCDPTAPRLPNDCLDLQNRLALLDPGIHPNLSVLSEVHQNIHFNAIMKMPEWQAKMIRCGPRIKTLLAATSAADRRLLKEELKHDRPRKFVKKSISGATSTVVKPNKHGFKKRGRKPSSSKSTKRRKIPDFDDHCDSSLSTNMSEESQNIINTTWPKETSRADRPAQRSTSFDIDNMVIPYGVPVTTKVQVLPYKEIITPKWRVVNYEPLENDDHNVSENRTSMESDEDISEENCLKRHMRCLLEERKKFGVYTKLSWTTRSRANRRLESKTMDIMPITPQSEHTSENELPQSLNETTESPENTEMVNMETIPSQPMKEAGNDNETVAEQQPFTPRQFPLAEDDYEAMVALMPAKHTEILNLMQSSESDDLVMRQSLTESVEQVEMDVTSPFNEVIIQKESSVDAGVLGQFTMTDSDESVNLDDPDDPEWG